MADSVSERSDALFCRISAFVVDRYDTRTERFHQWDNLTGMVGMDLIGLEIFSRIELRHQGNVVGSLGTYKINACLQMTQLRNLALHAEQFVLNYGD